MKGFNHYYSEFKSLETLSQKFGYLGKVIHALVNAYEAFEASMEGTTRTQFGATEMKDTTQNG